MADIPSSINKINDVEVSESAALSEAFFSKIGASINGLIDEKDDYLNLKIKTQTFNSSGTFFVPANVDKVILIGCGGGGGGGGGQGLNSSGGEAGAGGHGAGVTVRTVTVTPSSSVSVTIGSGGGGGAAGSNSAGGNGASGGSTFFGSTEFKGARGGRGGGQPQSFSYRTVPAVYTPQQNPLAFSLDIQPVLTPAPIEGGTLGGSGLSFSQDGYRGQDSAFALGGNGGTGGGGKSAGGGGGASIGAGGTGGDQGANNATVGGIGAGGGGGTHSTPNGGEGRAGGAGQLTVIWVAE